jgi:L-lactate utilization protein LutB
MIYNELNFGCSFCQLQPVHFNTKGEPCISNTPLLLPQNNRTNLPDEIFNNVFYCPKCGALINLIPKYKIGCFVTSKTQVY